MFGLFKHRVHEPVALAAVLAASMALHVLWIGALLITRSADISQALTLTPIGPGSGLYLAAAGVYALVFGLALLWFKGKDCSHWRDRVYWFFVASVLAYAVLTIPFISQVEIVGARV